MFWSRTMKQSYADLLRKQWLAQRFPRSSRLQPDLPWTGFIISAELTKSERFKLLGGENCFEYGLQATYITPYILDVLKQFVTIFSEWLHWHYACLPSMPGAACEQPHVSRCACHTRLRSHTKSNKQAVFSHSSRAKFQEFPDSARPELPQRATEKDDCLLFWFWTMLIFQSFRHGTALCARFFHHLLKWTYTNHSCWKFSAKYLGVLILPATCYFTGNVQL